MDLSQRILDFSTDYFIFFLENYIWVKEPLRSSSFKVSVAEIYIFILFVSTPVLFEGVFSLWVSSKIFLNSPGCEKLQNLDWSMHISFHELSNHISQQKMKLC